jgi:hypothetical protein
VQKDIIMASREELKRLYVVKKVIDRELSQIKAGELLGLSERQVRRIEERVLKEGEKGIVHRLRGRESVRKIDGRKQKQVIKVYRTKYAGFGPTLAVEKFKEIEGIEVSKETLRKWLIGEGLWERKRKNRGYRQWRERKEYLGEMVQVDGSHHAWLEGRGPKLVLMGYIDDATGRIYCRFYDYEGTWPVMDSFKRYVRKYGIPQSVYADRHSTYQSWRETRIKEELEGKDPQSEFGRALEELEVRLIAAYSPQAKGRVERLFGTLQDRLVKEMRLKGIKTKEEANEFLENGYLRQYNERFSVQAVKKQDLHQKVGKIDLNRILCIKAVRAVRNDYTISYSGRLYQILEKTRAQTITVEEQYNGTIKIYNDKEHLQYKEIVCRPYDGKMVKKRKETQVEQAGKQWVPPADHPWRKFKVGAAA